MTKKKKLLVAAVMIVGMIQSPQYALTPAINQIKTSVFPQYSLSTIQTVLMLSSIVSPLFSLSTAALIRHRFLSKRAVITAGLTIMGLTGVVSIFANTQLWHFCVLALMTGCATGCFLANMTSVLMDNFGLEERQTITGVQTIFINVGGFIFSILGGILSSFAWHGGYKIFFIGFPVAVFAFFAVPPGKAGDSLAAPGGVRVKSKLSPKILFYALTVMLFLLVFGVCGANMSTHLAREGFTSPSMAGLANAIQMAGGAVCGIVFGMLSRKLRDMMIPLAFFTAFVGFSVLNLFSYSPVMICVGAFLIGVAFSMAMPQCVVSVSKLVDETTSATATAIVAGFAPAIGSFLSPAVLTRVTAALAGESTKFRYQFTGFFALLISISFAAAIIIRDKKNKTLTAA